MYIIKNFWRLTGGQYPEMWTDKDVLDLGLNIMNKFLEIFIQSDKLTKYNVYKDDFE